MMLFFVAVPFQFVYSYLVARQILWAVPGLVGLLTYGLLVALVALAPTDIKIWRRRIIVFALLVLAYVLSIVFLNRFFLADFNPEVGRELFEYHAINVIRSLTFLLIGIHLTSNAKIGKVAAWSAVVITLVVLANTNLDSLSMIMPDIDELTGMYQFLGDAFAVITIIVLAYLRRVMVFVGAVAVALITLYLIGSRTSMYAFVPVAVLYGLLSSFDLRLHFNRIAFLIFLAFFFVIGLIGPFVYFDVGQNRMLAFIQMGEDSSWNFRQLQLLAGLADIRENPFFGKYGGDYQLFSRQGDYIHSHLEVWRQFGILPFILFTIVFIGAVRLLWRSRTRANEPAWRAAAALMLFSAISIIFSRTWGWPYIWLAIGMVSSFARRRSGLSPAPKHLRQQ